MRPFTYSRPNEATDAVKSLASQANAKVLGGGTNLLDLLKMGVEHPAHLVDITALPLADIEERNGGIRIGATVRNSDLAAHKIIRERYPLLSDAVLAGASPQIRNMATTGGNLMQRTRCYYFYDPSYTECNKRVPGSGCAAIYGYNRIHAILGASEQCIAVHTSDMAVALSALGARVVIRNPEGERSVPIDAFYRLPAAMPQVETVMTNRDLITAVDLPAPIANGHSHYLKVRDRNSFAFALVSVAAVVAVGADRRIQEARITLGGVAPKPWRVTEAEGMLKGKEATEGAFRQAAAIVVHGAIPRRYNGFKVELAQRAVVRALTAATAV